MFLLRSGFFWTRSFLDIDNQLLLGLVLVDRPSRVVGLILDVKSLATTSEPEILRLDIGQYAPGNQTYIIKG